MHVSFARFITVTQVKMVYMMYGLMTQLTFSTNDSHAHIKKTKYSKIPFFVKLTIDLVTLE